MLEGRTEASVRKAQASKALAEPVAPGTRRDGWSKLAKGTQGDTRGHGGSHMLLRGLRKNEPVSVGRHLGAEMSDVRGAHG
jgi:hypothetical protein